MRADKRIRYISLILSLVMSGSVVCACNDDAVSESTVISETIATTPTETTKETIEYTINNAVDASNVIADYASKNQIDVSSYPQEIIDLFVAFPDAYDFVMEYPLHLQEISEGEDDSYEYPDISSEISKVVVPKLYQWDTRWGYRDYCGKMFGANGSGPTCVSIAAIYFLGNKDLTPAWIMDYAINNSFCDLSGAGTYRTLITTGANNLGIDVVQITVDEDRVKRNLDVGNLVVCSMGSGIFSNPYEAEHFIIITGYSDEGFSVIDPASKSRTEQLWTWDGLATSMNIPWVYRMM